MARSTFMNFFIDLREHSTYTVLQGSQYRNFARGPILGYDAEQFHTAKSWALRARHDALNL